jgi:hypothetical protein
MADETLGVILVVQEWNWSRMIAAFKSQLECFVSHCVLAPLSFAAGFALRLFFFATGIPRYILDTSLRTTPGHSR